MEPLLGAHRGDLVGGNAFASTPSRSSAAPIACAAAARLRSVIHQDAGDAQPRAAGGLPGVSERSSSAEQCPDRPSFDRHEYDQRRSPMRCAGWPNCPIGDVFAGRRFRARRRSRGVPRSRPQLGADGIPLTCSGQVGASGCVRPRPDDGVGTHAMRRLVERDAAEHQYVVGGLLVPDFEREPSCPVPR